jgi:hypothetical protein
MTDSWHGVWDVEGHEENEEIVGKIKQMCNYKISLREKHREFEKKSKRKSWLALIWMCQSWIPIMRIVLNVPALHIMRNGIDGKLKPKLLVPFEDLLTDRAGNNNDEIKV